MDHPRTLVYFPCSLFTHALSPFDRTYTGTSHIIADHLVFNISRPDRCDGTYDSYCDKSREYSNISAILSSEGEGGLLSYMNRYWKDYQGDDENLWSHEWDKHGTCISTLEPRCYDASSSPPRQDVVDYFSTTVELFQNLPTYDTLANAGVLPSLSRTWTKEEIQKPLQDMHGAEVTLGCRGSELTEVWYYFSVRGPAQSGEYVAVEPDGSKGGCPGTGIRYLPKK
jgi:ribonuclease T2